MRSGASIPLLECEVCIELEEDPLRQFLSDCAEPTCACNWILTGTSCSISKQISVRFGTRIMAWKNRNEPLAPSQFSDRIVLGAENDHGLFESLAFRLNGSGLMRRGRP